MDKLLSWLENNQITCYQIFDVSKEKRSERQCTCVGDAITEFTKDYETLSNGKYFIKGMTSPKADRSAVRMDFTIGISNTNQGGSMDYEKIRKEMYEQARKDIEYQFLDKRLSDVERQQKLIIQVLFDLTDGDEENDDKAKSVIETLSNAKENFDSAKDILKNFSL